MTTTVSITTGSIGSALFTDADNRPYSFSGVTCSHASLFSANPKTTRHKLGGTVSVDGEPVERMVVVVDRRTFTFVAATTSNPDTGEWVIQGIETYPKKSLIVFAVDNSTGEYNAEVADFISQVATNPETVTEAEVE